MHTAIEKLLKEFDNTFEIRRCTICFQLKKDIGPVEEHPFICSDCKFEEERQRWENIERNL